MQDLTPSISVITVCYNSAKELERTIKSVTSQTYDKVEYIIIDGASTDMTPKVLKSYSNEIDRIVSEPDKGIYDAMNKGLKLATGDYVCFMNAGDCFHTLNTLSEVMEQLRDMKELPIVVYGETNIVNEEGVFIRERRLKAPQELKHKSFLKGMLVCHQSFYALRSAAPLYDLQYKYSSDVDWCLNILKQKGAKHNTKMILTDYLQEGATTKHRFPSLMERFNIMVKHYGVIPTLMTHIMMAIRLIFVR